VAAALRALAAALPFAALLDTLLGATRGYREMRPTVVIDRLGRSALQLAGVVAAVAVGATSLLAPLWALPYLPAAALAWLWLRRIRRRAGRAGRHSSRPRRRAATGTQAPGIGGGRRAATLAARQLARATPGGFWRFTAPRAVAALAQITIQRLDIVLVALLKGPREAAIYTAATRFLVAGQFANTAITYAAQPRFAELFAVGDRRGANQVYQATTTWLMLVTWPLYLLAMIYGPQVLTIFGHPYRAGGTVMLILAAAMLLATACGQVDTVLISTGRSGWSLANGLLAVGMNVALDLVLIPRYGITGAAIGWAAAIAVTNVVPLAQLAAVARVHPFGRGTLAACGLPVACFGALPLAARAVAGPGAITAAAAVAVGCLAFAVGIGRLRRPLHLPALPRRQAAGGRTR
jgi:O-antigen/teichoic acid export membrane protein